MKRREKEKFKSWFKEQDNHTLDDVYNMLAWEYKSRGKSISTGRNFYDSRVDSPRDISDSLSNHFQSVYEKHHGF